MIKYFLLLFIQFLISVHSYSQTNEGFPSITRKDLPDAKFTSERSFNGESLYGYINGGADLYLEYGFTGVTVTEFTWLKGKYKVEIYKMKSPESAYGIFSVSRFRCRYRPGFATFTCQNKYQLQVCSGLFYISIISESGTKADSAASLTIGKRLIEKISDPAIDLSEYFPAIPVETVRNESCLVKGRLGVINGAPGLDNYFKGADGYTAAILQEPEKTIISVKFATREALEKFAGLHKWEQDRIPGVPVKMQGGESVLLLNEKQVIIEIPPGS